MLLSRPKKSDEVACHFLCFVVVVAVTFIVVVIAVVVVVRAADVFMLLVF